MRFQHSLLIAALASATGTAWAGVTADEAKQLGSTLSATGAGKAGNKDGTIPAYSGGLTKAPAEFKAGEGLRPDPFAADKPLFSVDGKSMVLSRGARAVTAERAATEEPALAGQAVCRSPWCTRARSRAETRRTGSRPRLRGVRAARRE